MPGCKAGDIAQFIAPIAPEHLRGRFVEVLEAEARPDGCVPIEGPWFLVKCLGYTVLNALYKPVSVVVVPDAMLRPLGNPGPEEVDQMVRYVHS